MLKITCIRKIRVHDFPWRSYVDVIGRYCSFQIRAWFHKQIIALLFNAEVKHVPSHMATFKPIREHFLDFICLFF